MTDFKKGGAPTPDYDSEDINYVNQKTEFSEDVYIYGKLYAELSGDIIPDSDNKFDLGSPTNRWANLYTGDLQLSNLERGGNEVDGTEGKWTLQEGENDIFLINRKNGKKYKIKMEEV
tara:strand:- start:456 stop:809 length:354 start_codon:yes stop_codon:yes gene_type:complete